MSKIIEIPDETAEIVARISANTGQTEAQVIAEAVRDRWEAADLDALRSEIDRRIATSRRLPADEVFDRLEARHRRRMGGA